MSLHHNPRMVTSGIELHLDAADRMSYPGSGTTWYDLSGNGRHLTLVNGPVPSDKYFSFDGTGDYAERTSVGLSLSSFTIDTVVRPTSNPGNYRAFFSATEASLNDYEYGINWDMGPYSSAAFIDINVEISRAFGGFYNRDVKTSSTPFGTWAHLAIVVDHISDTYTQYVNGVAEYSSTYSGTITYFDRIRVGARFYSGGTQGTFFPGDIAKSTLYNRALTAAEVDQNYQVFRQRFGI
jgi:hypothetical protein